jgi:hypothetical protein
MRTAGLLRQRTAPASNRAMPRVTAAVNAPFAAAATAIAAANDDTATTAITTAASAAALNSI